MSGDRLATLLAILEWIQASGAAIGFLLGFLLGMSVRARMREP